MLKIDQYGFIKDGKLKILNRDRFNEDLREFPDCDVQIIVKRKGKRSSPQNRYYWGIVVDEIRREFLRRGSRHTKEEIHEALKLKFNPQQEINPDTGELLLEVGQSTTEMNKDEMAEYITRIIEWANTSLEIIIPEAGTQTAINY